jgi:3-methylcrotonyl-CoA carboxylase alpha subunit
VFSKILIANRGEIACRVIGTARRMGIATVAVYSAADAGALHVALADEARLIGPPPPRDSYLNIGAVIEAAQGSGAEAVHPGYGFLSENPEFAEACAAAGLVFIGPSPAAIRAMGSKAAAKTLMMAHGVAVVPGYHGDDQADERLLAEAVAIGFPVMIKASAGGGGRGMRIVRTEDEFAVALDGARREAQGAFADDRMLLESYLETPRHIEVQVFGDTHGNIVHLGERDCSIQRRHQKVVEEAPAPGLSPERRQEFGKAAVAAARAVDYIGAGTVEFITPSDARPDDGFYFMEMNTRLQVEHPVTEAVTGLDLVEWQLRVAAGERLPLRQDEIGWHGRAIEVRLYAENPARGFLPATGTLAALHLPQGEAIRVDTGVRAGDAITPFYDAMIAKIIVWGDDRGAARRRLVQALADTALIGVATNLGFLARLAGDPEFAAGRIDTGFIERRGEALLAPPGPPPDIVLAAAALHRLIERDDRAASDPWSGTYGWRPNLPAAPQTLSLRCEGEDHSLSATRDGTGWWLVSASRRCHAAAELLPDGRVAVEFDGTRQVVRILEHAETLAIFLHGRSWQLVAIDPLLPPAVGDVTTGRLTAPMPGRVAQLLVAAGDRVRQGQGVMVVEAMKMEHTIAAPRDGVVAAVHYLVGDLVEEGVELIALQPDADAPAGASAASEPG